MTPQPRPELSALYAYEPAPSLAQMARDRGLERIANLATNESQFGPPPASIEAVSRAAGDLHRYPDHESELIARIAALNEVSAAQVAVGNGADALIGQLCTAYLQPGAEVVMGAPSFATYVLDTLKMGAVPVSVPLNGSAFDVAALAAAVTPATRMLFVCNPNNPTGGIVTADELRWLLDTVPESVLIVLDEAYAEFVTALDFPQTVGEHVPTRQNVALLRTFSKIYGLAGLRVGYLIGAAPIVVAAGRVRHYYDVTSLGQLAALAALDDPAEIDRRRELTAQARTELAAELTARGYDVMPSQANFAAFAHPEADQLAERLLDGGVAVRTTPGFDAQSPGVVRITVGTEADHALLWSALDRQAL